jgi:hypothetical protein
MRSAPQLLQARETTLQAPQHIILKLTRHSTGHQVATAHAFLLHHAGQQDRTESASDAERRESEPQEGHLHDSTRLSGRSSINLGSLGNLLCNSTGGRPWKKTHAATWVHLTNDGRLSALPLATKSKPSILGCRIRGILLHPLSNLML